LAGALRARVVAVLDGFDVQLMCDNYSCRSATIRIAGIE